jgi:chorismate-pyruvate lyase
MQITFKDLSWSKNIPNNIAISTELKNIITAKSSLTKILRNKYHDKLTVNLLRNEWQVLQTHDSLVLNINKSPALIRDTIINAKTTPIIFARCCIPAISFSNQNKDLLTWKNTPIGDFIFSQKHHSRSDFMYSFINSKKFDNILDNSSNTKELFLIRYSNMNINFMPILIYEVFIQ